VKAASPALIPAAALINRIRINKEAAMKDQLSSAVCK
jgi:hypothetical protein